LYLCKKIVTVSVKKTDTLYFLGGVEDTLGSFYAPVRPLQEGTILQYRDDIGRIARRFFHQLLRYTLPY